MSEPLPKTATLLLRAPELPDPQNLLQTYSKHFADAPGLTVIEDDDPTTLSLRSGETSLSITLIAEPLAWTELEGPCETAWHFPQARKRLSAQNAHLSFQVEGETRSSIELMLTLTRLVAATALCTSALGVYVPSAMQVHNIKDFVREAEQATPAQLPLYLWLRFGLVREEDGSTSLYTTGMVELELMEVEIPHTKLDPQTLVDRAFNVAHYLLERGPVLEDGHTVGISADDKFMVKHAPSMLDEGRLVYQLSVAPLSAPSP